MNSALFVFLRVGKIIERSHRMKRNDWFLILGILVIAACFWLIRSFVIGGGLGGSVNVRIGGELVGTYSLYEDRTEKFEYRDGSYNVMVIANGKVSVIEADCPDKHCINKGEIYLENETIICLPHELVIKIIKSDNKGPDIIAE